MVNRPGIFVIDQGTSATKGFLFDDSLQLHYIEKIRHTVKRPRAGWVECDASEIASSCRRIIKQLAAEAASRKMTVSAVGMAFQRSTFLFWGKDDIEPIAPAMSWQDTRATELIKNRGWH